MKAAARAISGKAWKGLLLMTCLIEAPLRGNDIYIFFIKVSFAQVPKFGSYTSVPESQELNGNEVRAF